MRRMILLGLTIIGVAFLIPSTVMLLVFRQQTSGMMPVEGTISGWDGDTPLVSYTLYGENYTTTGTSSDANWPVGSPYRIMVDPFNPYRTTDYILVILSGTFGVMAFVTLLAGFITWGVMGRRERRREEILQYGLRTTAVVTELKQNRAVQVNGRHPWVAVVTCRHPSTREEMTLRSHMLWKPSIAEGDTIDMAFDPMDERRYAMDIPEAKK